MSFVRITSPIPAYRGLDGVIYGPFSKGTFAELDSGEAQFLISQGWATPNKEEKPIILIRIITPVEQYETSDERIVGPFFPGEKVELPVLDAEFLIQKGFAQAVSTEAKK